MDRMITEEMLNFPDHAVLRPLSEPLFRSGTSSVSLWRFWAKPRHIRHICRTKQNEFFTARPVKTLKCIHDYSARVSVTHYFVWRCFGLGQLMPFTSLSLKIILRNENICEYNTYSCWKSGSRVHTIEWIECLPPSFFELGLTWHSEQICRLKKN